MNSFHPKPSLARRRGNTIPHRRRHESKLRCRAGQCIMALREGWGIRLGGQNKKNPSLAPLKKVTSSSPGQRCEAERVVVELNRKQGSQAPPFWNRRCHERDWLRRLGIGVREAADLAAEVRHATGHWRERERPQSAMPSHKWRWCPPPAPVSRSLAEGTASAASAWLLPSHAPLRVTWRKGPHEETTRRHRAPVRPHRTGCRPGACGRGSRHPLLRGLPRRTHRVPRRVHQRPLLSRLRAADRLRLPPRGRLRGGDGAPADGPVPRWRLLPAWAPHL